MHLLFTAAELRLAVPAARVRRLSPPGDGALSLASALGREPRPGSGAGQMELTGVSQPLLADHVIGVVETRSATVAALPAGTHLSLPVIERALLLPGGIFLELAAEEVPARPPVALEPRRPPPQPPRLEPVRALVFRVVERRYAVSFSLVQAVLQAPDVVDVPLAPVPHRGVLFHGGSLLPVFDLPSLLGGRRGQHAPFVVLVDAGGEATGIAADEVEGVSVLHPPEDVTRAAAAGGSWMLGPSGEEVFLAACPDLFQGTDKI